MSVRTTHKTKLQTLLQTITYNGSNLVAEDHYINTADSYPYLFITSGDTTLDFNDNRNYNYKWTYNINLVFKFDDSISQSQLEVQMDDLEFLIMTQLASASARDGQGWLDCTIDKVSAPFQDDITITDNVVYKTFSIIIRDITQFA